MNAFNKLRHDIRLADRMICKPYTLKHCATHRYKDDKYVKFEHLREDYTDCIDILADGFTEMNRLGGRLYFCNYSPRDYFCRVDDTQNRQQIFMNKQAKECTSFRPTNCVLIHELLFGKGKRITVLDPFAGWGDRAIGFAAAGCSYTGVDLNKDLGPSYRSLVSFLEENKLVEKDDIRLVIGDSSDIDFGTECYDLVFTCPPYSDFEVYENIPQVASTDEWAMKTLQPAMLNAATALKSGGYMVFMIGKKEQTDTYVEELLFLLQNQNLEFLGNIGSFVRHRENRVMGMYIFKKK